MTPAPLLLFLCASVWAKEPLRCGPQSNGAPERVIAEVGGRAIPYRFFQYRVDIQRESSNAEPDKKRVLREMIDEELLALKAPEWGLSISDEDVVKDIRGTKAFRRKGDFDRGVYERFLKKVHIDNPREYQALRKGALLAGLVRKKLSRQKKPGAVEAYLRKAAAAAEIRSCPAD